MRGIFTLGDATWIPQMPIQTTQKCMAHVSIGLLKVKYDISYFKVKVNTAPSNATRARHLIGRESDVIKGLFNIVTFQFWSLAQCKVGCNTALNGLPWLLKQ